MAKRLSNWVNLQDYAAVNADQGRGMVDKVTGYVAEGAQAAQGALGAAKKKFAAGVLGAEVDDPNALTNGTTAEEALAKSKRTYTGPTELGTEELGAQVRDASERVAAAGTQGGQFDLLQKSYGGTGSSPGIGGGMMDAFLMSQGGGAAQLSGLGTQFGNLQDQYGLAQAEAAGNAEAARGRTTANAAGWRGKVKGLATTEKERANRMMSDAFQRRVAGRMTAAGSPELRRGGRETRSSRWRETINEPADANRADFEATELAKQTEMERLQKLIDDAEGSP